MTQQSTEAEAEQTRREQEQEANRMVEVYSLEIQGSNWDIKPRELSTGRTILDADPRMQIEILIAMQAPRPNNWRMRSLEQQLRARHLPWTEADLQRIMDCFADENYWGTDWDAFLMPLQNFVNQGNALTKSLEGALRFQARKLIGAPGAHIRKIQAIIGGLLGEDKELLPDAVEPWAETAVADLAQMPSETQSAWKRLLAHVVNSDSSKPTTAWRKAGRECVAAVGEEAFRTGIVRWFGAVTVPPMGTMHYQDGGRNWDIQQSTGSDRNISLLKGLAWLCADRAEADIARALAKLIEACIRKQPGVGPWAVRAASGAIWALTEMNSSEAIGQLGRLKTKVTFRTALNAIEKGLETAAKRAGVTKADLEDLSVPTYGFAPDGTRQETFGECTVTATLAVPGKVTVEWFGANGKPVKSVPAAVKKEFAASLKEFKSDVDAAEKMLSAQQARFDSFYLPERVWPLGAWQERFGSHPLLSPIARRLIWHFREPNDGKKSLGIWNAAQAAFVDVQDRAIDGLTDSTEVRLWHPIGFSVEEVLAWRTYLQDHSIVQPFKQAYREVYLLTEAELRTQTYSNRFAGHILKQHQMNSLAALRGWKNKLRLLVDDDYPPASRDLAEFGLRAEFWIEGAGDAYGVDTTETGTYLYLSTDQVRFYAINAPENYAHASGGGYTAGHWGQNRNPTAALPLTEVPALVFSEIMRDVDLFVGVCSVGNDPAWQDGGPQGRHQDYWVRYSFGELSATAQTRHAVLSRLLPRLKIAPRCTLTDRFLVVRGDLRTYKIHLGSGNILMEPNDEYLCIVQDRSASQTDTPVNFLPFEGDPRLALILSKAFLLAEDTRIKDETITRQILRGTQ